MSKASETKKKALVIDDDKIALDLFTFHLNSAGYDLTTAENGKDGMRFVRENEYDVVLTDLNLPDMTGIDMVRESKKVSPNTEIIVVTGHDSTETAVEAIRLGARDYILKPIDFEKLLIVINNAVETKRQNQLAEKQAAEIKELRGRLSSRTEYEGIIGGARSMQNIYEIIENVADSDANILILGESGTGKEVIANAIHYKSLRADQPFVKVNCSALPKDLFESQLFGHVKGSFTGASSDKIGFIGQAKGGSLLLDEIGEMPMELQPKLLRVLQEKIYYSVGNEKAQEADFRLICSTNRSPFEAITDGNLREDLYYRINTIEITIPPLRERMDDVPMLAEHFLQIYADKYNRDNAEFSQEAFTQMLSSTWRGNVRELQHTIERAVLLSKTGKIESLDIPDAAGGSPRAVAGDTNIQMASNGLPEFSSNQLQNTPQTFNLSGEDLYKKIGEMIVENLNEAEESEEQTDVFGEIESGVVLAALKKTRGNKQAAANMLGLYRPRLYGMIKRHNIDAKI